MMVEQLKSFCLVEIQHKLLSWRNLPINQQTTTSKPWHLLQELIDGYSIVSLCLKVTSHVSQLPLDIKK